jgi:hypothetical protein
MAVRLQHCGLIVADLERYTRYNLLQLGLLELPRQQN